MMFRNCFRRYRAFAILAATAIGVFGTSSAEAEHRTALLIGNAEYENGAALVTPPNNIRAVASVLRSHGFQIRFARDLNRKGIQDVLRSFIDSAPINGTALVYFTGSVTQDDVNGGAPEPVLLGIEGNGAGIPLSSLVDWIPVQAAVAQTVIVVDPCPPQNERPADAARTGISAIPVKVAEAWLGCAVASAGTSATPPGGLSAFAAKFSQSKHTHLEKMLRDACDWTRSTCRERPFSQPPTIAVAPPDRFPTNAAAGDEWVAPDGNVYCWCPYDSTAGFWAGKYEIVQCKWPNPNNFRAVGTRKNLPTTNLNSKEILSSLEKLTRAERAAGRLPKDWEYSLPSPEQWEHAARAGTSGERYFQDEDIAFHANIADKSLFDTQDDLYLYADRTIDDGASRPVPVGSYRPNPWGLHDLFGNVWEQTDTGVLCGGSWVSLPDYCRVSVRKPPLQKAVDFAGFRLFIRPVDGAR